MNRNSRIVAFAALFALAGLASPADRAAAADRRGDGGTPQQGVSSSHQPGPVEGQAKYQVDYHADYRAKGTQDEPDAKAIEDARVEAQRERDRERRTSPLMDRMLGRTPGAWGR